MKLLAVLMVLAVVCAPAAAGTLTLDHDVLTRRLRTEIPSGAVTYKDGRVVIRGVKKIGPIGFAFNVSCYFTRASGRVRLTAEALLVNGRARDERLAEVDAKLAPLVDELPADRVVIQRGGKVAFEQALP